MKIELLVTGVIAVGSPDIVERATLEVIFAGRCFANSGCLYGREAILLCKNPLLSPNESTKGHLMKIKWCLSM